MDAIGRPVIVAIDDDSVVLNLLVSILKEDYSIRPFTSGKEALSRLPSIMPNLILLDQNMPDISGLDVLDAIKNDSRIFEIPTIFITSASNIDSEVEALEHGAVDYIAKPVHHRSLLTRVRIQLELQAHRKHLEALVNEKTKDLTAAYYKLKAREEITLSMLARATDMRDHDTGDHVERTTAYTKIIVDHLLKTSEKGYELSRKDAEDIVMSSKLHDIGKIALPDSILLKPGKLTREEFEKVKEHTMQGERFLEEFIRKMDDSYLDTAREIAFGHHEHWDGRGYPLGLKGEEIPLSARIVAISDVYDALTSKRSYKQALSHSEAMKIMQENSGTQFDPFLISIFVRFSDNVKGVQESMKENPFEGYAAI